MKIVFVHHHLRPGGVTKVITEQIHSLGGAAQCLVICGERPQSPVPFPFKVIPALAYDRDKKTREDPARSAGAVLDRVRSFWKDGADIFHFHNPTLGKNRDFVRIINCLLAQGIKALLQIHDFSEDGRPQNYSGEEYPKNCHYAVINSRDYQILIEAGLTQEGLHLIPDSVKPLPVQQEGEAKDLVLYPIRAIRRKNVGEAILLALFLGTGKKVGITLEPTGPLDVRSYTDWMDFVKTECLPVLFRLGIEGSFESALGRSRCILTTSIKEGFGLAFLEAWMENKMLFGRLLPDICQDFIRKGIKLDDLYHEIVTPLDFIDRDLFFRKWKRCYHERLGRYGLEVNAGEVEAYFDSVGQRGSVDFGMLSEDLQCQVIQRAARSGRSRRKLISLNPFLEKLIYLEEDNPIIEHNQSVIAAEYSPSKNKERLLETYRKVAQKTPQGSIRKEVPLRRFNTPEKNHLLLCNSSYD
jgi:glycosyltransferase involved in cell wall biosynthesis